MSSMFANNNSPLSKIGPLSPGDSLSPGKDQISLTIDSPSKQQHLIQTPPLDSNDTKVLIESDKLQKDLKVFLESLTQKQSVFSKMIIGSKRSSFEQAYEALVKRIEISETGLRKIYTDSKVHDTALTTQACQLYLKVSACLKFSAEAIPSRKRDGEMLAGLLTDINAWIQYLWTMIRFQQELIHQEQTQALFLPEMMSDPAPRMAALSGEREDDIIMIQKLRKIKKLRKKVARCLERVRAGHEEQIGLVSPLEQTHLRLAQTLAAKLRVDVTALNAEVRKFVSAQSIASCSNHSTCRNCGLTNSLTGECMVHLDNFESQKYEVVERLQGVMKLKNAMKDALPTIDAMK